MDRLITRQRRLLLDATIIAWHRCTQMSKEEWVFFKTGSRGIFGVSPLPFDLSPSLFDF